MLDNKPESLEIADIMISGEGSSKQAVFMVRAIDREGVLTTVARIYPDFLKIRRILIDRWPGIFIPYLSPKSKNVKFHELQIKEIILFYKGLFREEFH